ncbi:hypothetical protein BGX28_002302 [Mortierella sp. GBA30]|nr:hypothetical protein BGX28_002302 [Mortierella sp. GBA30]
MSAPLSPSDVDLTGLAGTLTGLSDPFEAHIPDPSATITEYPVVVPDSNSSEGSSKPNPETHLNPSPTRASSVTRFVCASAQCVSAKSVNSRHRPRSVKDILGTAEMQLKELRDQKCRVFGNNAKIERVKESIEFMKRAIRDQAASSASGSTINHLDSVKSVTLTLDNNTPRYGPKDLGNGQPFQVIQSPRLFLDKSASYASNSLGPTFNKQGHRLPIMAMLEDIPRQQIADAIQKLAPGDITWSQYEEIFVNKTLTAVERQAEVESVTKAGKTPKRIILALCTKAGKPMSPLYCQR